MSKTERTKKHESGSILWQSNQCANNNANRGNNNGSTQNNTNNDPSHGGIFFSIS